MKDLSKIKNPRTTMELAWNELMDEKGVTKERYVKRSKKKRPYKGRKNNGRTSMEKPKKGISKGRKDGGRPSVEKEKTPKRKG